MIKQKFYATVSMLANTTATYKRGIPNGHMLATADNLANAFCDGSHYTPYGIAAKRDKSLLHFTFYVIPGWTLSDHYIQFDVCVPITGTVWYVTSSVINQKGDVLPKWGKCRFSNGKFAIPSYIEGILGEVGKKYQPMKQKELAANDSELARAQSFVPELKKKFDAIQAFCKKNKLSLWLDTSVESVGIIEVLPAGTEAVDESTERRDSDLRYNEKAIPTIDIGVSCYDHFYVSLVRPNGKPSK